MENLSILAVDDDEFVLRLLSQVLTRAGYSDVRTCLSPKEALRMVRSNARKFDCFMLDIQMPGMDGIELCDAIRRTPSYSVTPILMLTALSEKSFVDRAFAAGATDYLTKPFDPREVSIRLGLARQLVAERNVRLSLAGQLVAERKLLSENTEIVDSFIKVMEKTTNRDLIEAIDLGKMDGLLSYPAFENYLYQTGRSVLFLASVFAVKIHNVKNWHQKLPPLEFKEVLRQSAREIINRLKDQELFLTYRGNGEFVGVIPRRGVRALTAIGDSINLEINESDGRFGEFLPSSLKLVIGDPVANRLPTRGGLLKNILAALEKVQAKADPDTRLKSDPTAGTSIRAHDEEGLCRDKLKAEFQELLEDKLLSEIRELGEMAFKTKKTGTKHFRFKAATKARTESRYRKPSLRSFEGPKPTLGSAVRIPDDGLPQDEALVDKTDK